MLARRALVPVLALVLFAGCAPKYTDPQTAAAAKAKEAVQVLGELQSAVIHASDTGGMPAPAAILVVKFTTASIRTVQQTPYGWGPSVRQGWAEVKARVGSHPSVLPYVPTIEALLALVGGPQ